MKDVPVFIALITWLIPIGINIYLDRNGAKRNYFQVNTIRGIALVVHGALFFNLQGGYFYKEDILRNIPIVVFYFTSYWLFFEAGLNMVTGRIKEHGFWKGLLYFDQREGDSGWIDGFFKKFPQLHTPAKLAALGIMIISIVLIVINH
jgi:hypothetical protein